MMARGPKPKTVIAVELLAVNLWRVPDNVDPVLWWRRVQTELFGMGELLSRLRFERASSLAFWLSLLAVHLEGGYGDLPLPSQSDFAEVGAGR